MNHSVHFIDNEHIHEITVGIDPKQDLRFTVGRTYLTNTPNPLTITAVEVDENYITEHSIIKVKIWAKHEKQKEEFLWKVLVDVPITITCKL